MSKFKIGDRVKNKADINYGFVLIPRGATGTVNQDGSSCPFVKWDKYSQTARLETDLELINENSVVVIYTKENETVATLKQGKEVLKSAKAKCSPQDEFNFEFGTKLAFERLFKEEVKEVSFDWDGFRNAEFAVHCDTEEKAKTFFKELKTQGIKWSSNEELIGTKWNFNKQNTCYGFFDANYKGICYGNFNGRKHVEYIPTTPQVKKVKRKAEVGEWIKIIYGEYAGNGYEVGEIFQVVSHDRENWPKIIDNDGDRRHIAPCEYVVLENYIPSCDLPKEKTLADFTKLEIIEELFRRCKEE